MARRNYDERSRDNVDAHRAVSFYNLASIPDPQRPPEKDHPIPVHGSHPAPQHRTIAQPLHPHPQYHHSSRATQFAPNSAHSYPSPHHHLMPSAHPQVSQQYAVNVNAGVNHEQLYGQVVPPHSSPQQYVATEATHIPHPYAHPYYMTPMRTPNYSLGGHLLHGTVTTPYHNQHYPHPPVQPVRQPFHPTHPTHPMANTATPVHTSPREQPQVTLSPHQDGKVSLNTARTKGGTEKGRVPHAKKIVETHASSMRPRKRRTNAVPDNGGNDTANDISGIKVHGSIGDTRADIGNGAEQFHRAPIHGSGVKPSDARKTGASLQCLMHSGGAGPRQVTTGLTGGTSVPDARRAELKGSLAPCSVPTRDSRQHNSSTGPKSAHNFSGGATDVEFMGMTTRKHLPDNNVNEGTQKMAHVPRKSKSTTRMRVDDDVNVRDSVTSRMANTPTAAGDSLRQTKNTYGLNILASAAEEKDRSERRERRTSGWNRQNRTATPSQPGKDLFPCSLCSVVVGSRSALNRHIRRIHLHQRPFQCEICRSSFGQRSDLKRHVMVRHSQQVEKKE